MTNYQPNVTAAKLSRQQPSGPGSDGCCLATQDRSHRCLGGDGDCKEDSRCIATGSCAGPLIAPRFVSSGPLQLELKAPASWRHTAICPKQRKGPVSVPAIVAFSLISAEPADFGQASNENS